MTLSYSEMLSFGFLETLAMPIATGAMALAAIQAVEHVVTSAWFKRRRPVRITLPDGRTEYLDPGDEDELRRSLARYLSFETDVRTAIRDLQTGAGKGGGFEVLETSGGADFRLMVDGRTYLVEAKIDADPVTGSEIRRYLSTNPSDRLLLITQRATSRAAMERLRADGGDRVRFLTGDTADAIRQQLTQALEIGPTT